MTATNTQFNAADRRSAIFTETITHDDYDRGARARFDGVPRDVHASVRWLAGWYEADWKTDIPAPERGQHWARLGGASPDTLPGSTELDRLRAENANLEAQLIEAAAEIERLR
jgi:hypothetical protein